ncbi:uncharacterized protein LOC121913183 isoform X2 [Scomber scombrus]|uniref:Uncharacterized protein LOC121913183 isoform X2 n=1 Tax=Scomber scombrus TaxID=13677 RepID=A0AAV1QDE0_SCOSC
MNIYSCLLALLLACNVTAEIIYQGVEEKKQPVPMPCPHSVEGKVTWSRETDGRIVDIFAIDGDREIRLYDPQRRYGSRADKSLVIIRLIVSDSGTYYCNNEPAAGLTVIPSGTEILQTTERSSITLTCPHDDGGSHVPTWSREIGGKQKPIRLHDSTKTLMFSNLQPADSGLYLCDGKPAVYLNVIKDEDRKPTTTTSTTSTTTTTTTQTTTTQTTTIPPTTTQTTPIPPTTTQTTPIPPTTTQTTPIPPTTTQTTPIPPTTTQTTPIPPTSSTTTTTTVRTPTRRQTAAATTTTSTKKQKDVTTTPTTSAASATKTLYLGLGVVVPFVVLLLLIIAYCTWRRRFKRREEEFPVYDEIQEGGLKLKKRMDGSGGASATYCMAGFPGTSLTNESPYSLITNPLTDGNKQGLKKQTNQPNQNDPTYHTIFDAAPTGNRTGTSVTNESPYSLITNPLPDGNKQGLKKQTNQPNQNDPTYHTISAPTGNRTDTSLTN